MSSSSSVLTAFVGSLQASMSVLLTIAYGVLAAQFKLITEGSAKDISKACVFIFLPALLIHNVGSQLHLETAANYVPILIFACVTNFVSVTFGSVCTRVFKLPSWITPAIAFNNTTSLPLLLVQSLNAAGVLAMLDAGDNAASIVERAKSYFLVNAMVSNSLTFAVGPRLLSDANAAGDELNGTPRKRVRRHSNGSGSLNGTSVDIEFGRVRHRRPSASSADAPEIEEPEDVESEETSLLPSNDVAHPREQAAAGSRLSQICAACFARLPRWVQSSLAFTVELINAPLVGAVTGAVIGLTPALQRLFFAAPEDGGYFRAWLTVSIKNVGDLFAALQILIVGVKLAQAMARVKQGKDSGAVHWKLFVFVTAVRYLVWPLLSISIVWALAAKTGFLIDDPLLWFCMMLMPTGPPALKLSALADVSDVEESQRLSVAKFLTLSYVISPLIVFAVVGALKASQAARVA